MWAESMSETYVPPKYVCSMRRRSRWGCSNFTKRLSLETRSEEFLNRVTADVVGPTFSAPAPACGPTRRERAHSTRIRRSGRYHTRTCGLYSPGYQRPGVVHSGPGGAPSAGHMYLSGNLTHVGGSG